MAASIRLKDLVANYKRYVVENVDLVTKVESALRILSYLIPAKFDNSEVLSELLYSSCNLLVLLHDAIIKEAVRTKRHLGISEKRISFWLSVLDYIEVLLELTARHWGGSRTKWIVIFCVQIAKAVMRYLLLVRHKSGIQQCPVTPPLNRERHMKQAATDEQQAGSSKTGSSNGLRKNSSSTLSRGLMSSPSMGTLFGLMGAPEQTSPTEEGPATFSLNSSGRKIRTLAAAPRMSHRTWKVPDAGTDDESDAAKEPSVLTKQQMLAEAVHIARPPVHLLTQAVCGTHSWAPWAVSLFMDISSLVGMGDTTKLNKTEREELRRRGFVLLLYLLRSPFYDRFTRMKLMILLHVLAYKVPLAKIVANPLLEYLPFWQKIYSYVWMV